MPFLPLPEHSLDNDLGDVREVAEVRAWPCLLHPALVRGLAEAGDEGVFGRLLGKLVQAFAARLARFEVDLDGSRVGPRQLA